MFFFWRKIERSHVTRVKSGTYSMEPETRNRRSFEDTLFKKGRITKIRSTGEPFDTEQSFWRLVLSAHAKDVDHVRKKGRKKREEIA